MELTVEERQQAKAKLTIHRDSGLNVANVRAEISVDEEGRIEAYAAHLERFNQHNDWYLPGCFEKSIKERFEEPEPSKIKVLWRHYQALGMPLEMKEDGTGLWTVSQIIDHKDTGKRYWTLIREGVVDGLSIGFNWSRSICRWLDPAEWEELGELGNADTFWYPPCEYSRVDVREYSFTPFPSDDIARVEAARDVFSSFDRLQVRGWRPEPPAPPTPTKPSIESDLRALLGELKQRETDNLQDGLRGLLADLQGE